MGGKQKKRAQMEAEGKRPLPTVPQEPAWFRNRGDWDGDENGGGGIGRGRGFERDAGVGLELVGEHCRVDRHGHRGVEAHVVLYGELADARRRDGLRQPRLRAEQVLEEVRERRRCAVGVNRHLELRVLDWVRRARYLLRDRVRVADFGLG